MRRGIALWLLLCCCGCTPAAVEEMGGEAPAEWKELDALMGEPMMSVGYPLTRDGNIAAAKQAAAGEKFKTAVTNFEQGEIPSDYSDEAAEKQAAVDALKAMISAAESETDEVFKAKYDAAMAALGQLRR